MCSCSRLTRLQPCSWPIKSAMSMVQSVPSVAVKRRIEPCRRSRQIAIRFCYNEGNALTYMLNGARSLSSQEIWVNVAEGARRTGYNLDHVRKLARDSWRLPENERPLRVRKDNHAYAIWLPDLINYVERRIPATMQNIDLSAIEATWVNASEAAEITGYHRDYTSKLALQM